MGHNRLVRREGFTLLELMTAVAILGILATLAFPTLKRMSAREATKASATQVAGLLNDARSSAVAEGTPHLVYFNAPEAGEAGGCPALAVDVRDADHSYTITPGDTTREFKLDSDSCNKVKPFVPETSAADLAAVPLPAVDDAARAPDAADKKAQEAAKKAAEAAKKAVEEASKGKGSPPIVAPPAEVDEPRSATVAETVVNGATFPIDATDGRTVVAFSERGIPVDPATPNEWGSGAGAVYLTDGESTVAAAIVAPLGAVTLQVFNPGTGDWR